MSTKRRVPRGLKRSSRKTWDLDGDQGKSAYTFIRKHGRSVKPGHAIHVHTANQMGERRYLVTSNIRGKKTLKETYNPLIHLGYGGRARRTMKKRGRRNTKTP
jgi:hypothetical protein